MNYTTIARRYVRNCPCIIDKQSHVPDTGQSIIVPAHAINTIHTNERFKMISTVIKSGYD